MIALAEPWQTLVVGGGFLSGIGCLWVAFLCAIDPAYRSRRWVHGTVCLLVAMAGVVLLSVALAVADSAVGEPIP